MGWGIELAERGWLPDPLLEWGIRRLCAGTFRKARTADPQVLRAEQERFEAELRQGPLALATEAANAQHYEVPADFYGAVLGPRRKYSCCLYERHDATLAEAEAAMLALYVERGGFRDGQDVLELGCGWGSLTLYLAERFPASRIAGVSNSASQREFIMGAARGRGLRNVEIRTADMNAFASERTFDRVVSIEMFEHMRNHAELLRRIAGWLRPEGRLFVHVFVHRSLSYPFETAGDENWMGRHFFTGGLMPADDLLLRCQDDLTVERHWRVGGQHYEKTSRDWLANLDRQRAAALAVLRATHGADGPRMLRRWRMFFLACQELFGYDGGREWHVSHYRFAKRA